MKRLIITLSVMAVCMALGAQTPWTLDDCLNYAHNESYAVLRARLQAQNAEIAERSARAAITPSINAGAGQDFSFGLAQGANNVKENRTQATTSFYASVSMPIFTGLRATNAIKRSQFDARAALMDVEATKENIDLNVMSYYLQALYSSEMVAMQEQQLALCVDLEESTRIEVQAGRKAAADLIAAQAQTAQATQQLVEAKNARQLALLDLCQLINYRDFDNFAIAPLDTAFEYLLPSAQDVYNSARNNRPQIKAQEARVQSAEYAIKEAQADYYPQLSLSASWGTGYYHIFNYNNPAFGKQFVNNGSEVVGLQLSIPIYNKMQTQHAVARSRIALNAEKIAALELEDQLYKEIQNAYFNATAADATRRAADENMQAQQLAFEYAKEKYQAGKLGFYDLQQAQTNYYKAGVESKRAKYDYCLRCKILEYYSK